jgi:hypothetical protein
MASVAVARPETRGVATRRRRSIHFEVRLVVRLGALVLAALFGAGQGIPSAAGEHVSVVIAGVPGGARSAERAVAAVGGRLERRLSVISGVSAMVPRAALSRLRATAGIQSVSLNATVRLAHAVDGFDASADLGSMPTTARIVGATSYWSAGFTGKGVDVALIDSGVVAVPGLATPGKIVDGPDLSFESELANLRHLDTYGHGTHMAGIIAGRDTSTLALKPNELKNDHDNFIGIAPDARLVNVKVAGHSGATDVSQVIAGIDWVVQHRNTDGLNIGVLNLSFGTDGVQDYLVDPLAYAAEVAWHKGIVVVVAAGNGGYGTAKLNNPAYDPYLIAVGASDPKGTMASSDDVVASFSSTGDGDRNPDFVSPGKSLVSLRAPGSYVDSTYPLGRVGSRYFRGSGTSQAAAVVSGLAALLIQQRPGITPDQVKALLKGRAKTLPEADSTAQGSGMVFLDTSVLSAPLAKAPQDFPRATGLGSIDQSRGSVRIALGGSILSGEETAFGKAWNGSTWSAGAWAGNTWSGDRWLGSTWSGSTWSGNTWSGNTWSGNTWSGNTWSGNTWSGSTWSGNTWSGNTWSGNTWSGSTWSARGWE